MSDSKGLPKVAVVGRPNVGKSTLVNRLAGRRGSIVGPSPGLTRDRLDTEIDWAGRRFIMFDTGGIGEQALQKGEGIGGKVAERAVRAAESADVVLFVVDAQAGPTSEDLALATRLRRADVPVILAANKADNQKTEAGLGEFWSLGIGEPHGVSALHGAGSGDLLDLVTARLPKNLSRDIAADIPSIALVGRPNVGKSSLFNRIAGEERALVHEDPGTTRDSVDTTVTLGERTYRFVDTAGLRKRSKGKGVEIPSASRTRTAIERADLAILVVDARDGATVQDQRIAREVAEGGVGAIVAVNKWDLIEDEDAAGLAEGSIADRLQFVDYAPMVRTSALTKRGVERLLRQIDPVLEARTNRVSTGALNELIQKIQQESPVPRQRNRAVKVYYGTQAEVSPPAFVLFTNGPLAPAWQRYFQRKVRENFNFKGNPVQIVVRQKER